MLRLTIAEVWAIIQYIEEHKEAVMAVHRQIEERIAEGNPPEIEARMAESPTRALIQVAGRGLRKTRQEKNGESDPL